MKRILTILLSLVVATVAMAQHTYVLSIGISNYEGTVNDLRYAGKDAKSVYSIFKKQPNTTAALITGKNATPDNIDKKLNAIVKLAKPGDKIIFFYSGHGDLGSFICTDLSEYEYDHLVSILGKAKTHDVFCFIDACFSGSVKYSTDYPWITFMSASRSVETSQEHPELDHGFFAQGLIKGLRGMSDANSDHRVTVRELFNYTYNDVITRTKTPQHHPQLIGPSAADDKVIIDWNR